MGATFEQEYGDVIREFVEYANKEPKLIRLDFLDACAEEFINMKMARWRIDDEKGNNGRDKRFE